MFKEIEKDIKEMLMPGEEVLFVARQSRFKPGGSLATPNAIYITNRRVIFRNPKLFGLKKNYVDIDYRDISNIRVKKGIFSTEIYLKSRFLSDEVRLPAIDKEAANQVIVYIRKGIRGELPGQIISEKMTEPVIETPKKKEDPLELLEKLARLKEAGIITEEEFQEKKKKLLQQL
ncbi:MAG: PH domain-containing protein [archaeon GB-1867-005]|nr:PH domain-containing protein [Candidatus Culexmicrobium cathedralense]